MTRVFSFLLASLLAISLQAQSPDASAETTAPDSAKAVAISVEELINNYLEAIGGVENWQKIESMTFAGMAHQGGMDMPTTVYSMRPKSTKIVVDIMDKVYVDCTNGDEGWTINPFMGSPDPQRKSKEE
ncbi:MAG TPA: hypothetical protein ENJ88_05295, partial [Phaeodactylibacter sp.]|nr:hypothetical protein [Phaeodactylibacter sp.]